MKDKSKVRHEINVEISLFILLSGHSSEYGEKLWRKRDKSDINNP